MEDKRTYADLAKQIAALDYNGRELLLAFAEIALVAGAGISVAPILGIPSQNDQLDEFLNAVAERLDLLAAQRAKPTPGFEPGRWWRVIGPDGRLWCETSVESEARERMRVADHLVRQYVKTETIWIEESTR